MHCNVGSPDRIIRILTGVALIDLTVIGIIGAWGWVGLIPLVTGAIGICPAYLLMKIRTCPAPKQD